MSLKATGSGNYESPCLLAANVVSPISVKRSLVIETNAIVSECTVCYHSRWLNSQLCKRQASKQLVYLLIMDRFIYLLEAVLDCSDDVNLQSVGFVDSIRAAHACNPVNVEQVDLFETRVTPLDFWLWSCCCNITASEGKVLRQRERVPCVAKALCWWQTHKKLVQETCAS